MKKTSLIKSIEVQSSLEEQLESELINAASMKKV